MNRLYPLFLKLSGKTCLVVGGGEVALSKARGLAESDARIKAVAPEWNDAWRRWSAGEQAELVTREFEPGDLDGAWLAIAASNRDAVNRAVFEAAESRGILCNAVDAPDQSRFFSAPAMTQGDLKIAVSTNGKAPALAARIRDHLDETFGEPYAVAIEGLGRLRNTLRRKMPHDGSKRRDRMKAYQESDELMQSIANGETERVRALLEAWLADWSEPDHG